MTGEKRISSLLSFRVGNVNTNMSHFTFGIAIGVGFLALFLIFGVWTLGDGLNDFLSGLGEFLGGIGYFFRGLGSILIGFVNAITKLAEVLGKAGKIFGDWDGDGDWFEWL